MGISGEETNADKSSPFVKQFQPRDDQKPRAYVSQRIHDHR